MAGRKSAVRRVREQQYSRQRAVYLAQHDVCEAEIEGCTYHATDIHHKQGRGPNLLKEETWLACCRSCHNWIEANSDRAKEMGLDG